MRSVYHRWIIAILVVAFSPISTAREKLVFSCVWQPHILASKELFTLYRDTFDSLNIDFAFNYYEYPLSNKLANTGLPDGICSRVRSFVHKEIDPELVLVDVAVLSVEMQLWSNSAETTLESVNNLSSSNIHIGYTRGIRWSADYLIQQKASHVIPISNRRLGMKMLAGKQLDLFIANNIDAKYIMDTTPALHNSVHLVGTLQTIQLYPFLHRKHRHLVAPFSAELKRLLEGKNYR